MIARISKVCLGVCCILSAGLSRAGDVKIKIHQSPDQPQPSSNTQIDIYQAKPVEKIAAPKKAAIFIANRADSVMDDQVAILEDMVISQVSDLGFDVISREIVIDAVGGLTPRGKQNGLDAVLDDQTSALRLAQNMGADYLLFVSLIGMDEEQRSVHAYGVNFNNEIYTLRATYRILDGNTGGSISAGMVNPERVIQQTKHSHTLADGLFHELLAKASREIASAMETKTVREVQVQNEQVSFEVVVSLNDINFPQAVVHEDGTVRITANLGTVQPLAVTVELDGFVIGTTGSGDTLTTLTAATGLHRLRLMRDDLIPYERMINIHEGMQLNIAMQLNQTGLDRWHENTLIYNQLMEKAKLTEAEIEIMRGRAQQLRQSGYKVDMTVDTEEGVTVKKNLSLMNQD